MVKNDRTVDARTVHVSRLAGEEAIVALGVSPGETVVTDGQSKLKNGSVVVIAELAPPAATNERFASAILRLLSPLGGIIVKRWYGNS